MSKNMSEVEIRKDERIRIGKALKKFLKATEFEIMQGATLDSIVKSLAKGGTGKD